MQICLCAFLIYQVLGQELLLLALARFETARRRAARVLDLSLAAALGVSQCFVLLVVEVAEVQAPEDYFLFAGFVPEFGEGVAQFFGDTQAQ